MSESAVDVYTIVAYVGLVLLGLGALWAILPVVYGTSGARSRPLLIRAALKLANLQPGERFYDLGAGDGQVAVLAAREFQARAVGVEIEPVRCVLAWLRVLFGGVIGRVSIRQRNLFDIQLDDADVVFLHLAPSLIERLRPHLILKLCPGARVISVYFPFEGWEPFDIDIGHLLFAYRMPPKPGSLDTFLATWRTSGSVVEAASSPQGSQLDATADEIVEDAT